MSIRLLFWYSVPTGIVVIVVTNWASLMSQLVKNPSANAGDARDVDLILGWGKIPWRKEWQPTPVFLPGESHGQRSLVG